jgi:hypothetical protein
MDGEGLVEHLRPVVGAALGQPVVVEDLVRLPGGASKDTWSFSVRGSDGSAQRLVLRRDRAGWPGSGVPLEAELFQAAARAPVCRCPASWCRGTGPTSSEPRF